MPRASLALLLALAGTAGAEEPACGEDAVYPGATWEDATEEARRLRPDAVAAMDAWAFPGDLEWGDEARRGIRSEAVIVVQGGRVLYERTANGWGPDDPRLTWSVSKTPTALLTGIAVGRGVVAPDASVCTWFDLPEPSCAVTVEHLLEFSSGFDWLETYEGGSPTGSSVVAMLYGAGAADMARFVGEHPLRDPPGTSWMYSSGDTTLLSGVLHEALAPEHGDRWPFALLLDPIGVTTATWEVDGQGRIVGSSHLYASPRDMARLGLLIARDGCWAGERLVPDRWIAGMSTVSEAIRTRAYSRDAGDVQGRQLWLNRPLEEGGSRPWPSVPEDTVAARGHWGQSIVAIPSLDLVVVRTADDRARGFDFDRFVAHAVAIAGEGPIPGAERPERPEVEELPPPNPDRRYEAGLLRLATGFSAKTTCSCLRVMERDEAYCREWTRVSPDVARARAKGDEVRARALGMARSTARYLGEEEGCVLER